MPFRILGLHHVTATVDHAQADLDFTVDALGLRLIKKTVNFDNHHVYHFYYGDERGTPGTIWTTFPYHGRGVPVGVKGAGQITATSFSVPAGSLEFWRRRLTARGVPVRDVEPRFDDASLVALDPSGLAIELIATDSDTRSGRAAGGVEPAAAIRGLHSVSMVIRSPEPTIELLTELLGFEVTNETAGRIRLSVNGGGPGKTLDLVHAPAAQASKNGLGTVHHVALAVATLDEQARLRQELISRGSKVTDVLNRQYFQSIYFREPGGVLLEVATILPGFTIDEPLANLGQGLKLPPWEEAHRRDIEKGLPEIVHP